MYNDRIKFVNHKGRKILIADYSEMAPQSVLEMIEEVKKTITGEQRDSVLFLGVFENMHFNLSIIGAFNKLAAATKDYLHANAMYGVKGLVKVMYDQYIKLTKFDAKLFNDLEEAKDWLSTK